MVAILSASVLPSIRLTVDEYLQADLPEGQRYELVDGVIEMTPAPNRMHDEPIDTLQDLLYAYKRGRPGAFQHLSQRAGVPIPGSPTVREPDLALYDRWERPSRGLGAWKDVTPYWVAEVISPGQEKRDYEDKRHDYWLAGIQEYWIIDGQRRCVTVLARGENDWTETVFGDTQEAVSQALPGFAVPVARLVGSPELR
jgi:Uma2 family endonuclease